MNKTMRTLHEVICTGHMCHIHFDIDLYLASNKEVNGGEIIDNLLDLIKNKLTELLRVSYFLNSKEHFSLANSKMMFFPKRDLGSTT